MLFVRYFNISEAIHVNMIVNRKYITLQDTIRDTTSYDL